MSSGDIDTQIQELYRAKARAQNKEARARCKAIFGKVPRDYGIGIEEMLGAVARIYVLRAFKRDDLKDRYLPDEDWIRLWHRYEPTLSVKQLLEITNDYIAEGCGISG